MKQLLIIGLLFLSATSLAQKQTLRVFTDERMEFLNIIQYLSDYPILNQDDSLPYKQDIEQYFALYKDHMAIRLHRQIYRRMFGFDIPVNYIYHFDFPGFRQEAPFADEIRTAYRLDQNRDTLDLLREAFRAFYRDSRFGQFFRAHQPFYDSLKLGVLQQLSRYDIVGTLEDHYGPQPGATYNLVLCPLLHDGGYAIDIDRGGKHSFYALVGPGADSISRPPKFDAALLVSEYVLHEFSHNFCNPVIDRHWARLQAYDCLLAPIGQALRSQGYGSWKACLYEHLVRANEIVLNERLFGRRKANELYRDFVEEGSWIYLRGLLPIVRNEYAAKRRQHHSLDSVMPQIIAYLESERRKCR